jgi:hypothetical protein
MTIVIKAKEDGRTIIVLPESNIVGLKINPATARPLIVQEELTFATDEQFLCHRIKDVEAPVLKSRGFAPVSPRRIKVWRGLYRGYLAEIRFPPQYPALPFEWIWINPPPHFPNIVLNRQNEPALCIDRILDKNKWNPAIGTRGIFEMMDDHPYFQRR